MSNYKSSNMFDKNNIVIDEYIDIDGNPHPESGWYYSDKIKVLPNTTYFKNQACALYDSNGNFITYQRALVTQFTTPSNVAYIIFTGLQTNLDSAKLNVNAEQPYEEYGYSKVPKENFKTVTNDNYREVLSDLDNADDNNVYVFNFAYGTTNLPLHYPMGYSVGALPILLTITTDYKIQYFIHTKTIYRRIYTSTWEEWKVINTPKYVVDINGGYNSDYYSITRCLFEHQNEDCDIYIRNGVYDLYSDFISIFGNDVWDSGFNSCIFKEGLTINKQRLHLDSNAEIRFDYTDGVNQNVIDYFSPFKTSGESGMIEGGRIVAINCRYTIHDDVYPDSERSHTIIKDCFLYYKGTRCPIGGGLGKSSTIEVVGCHIVNYNAFTTPSEWALFYHNNSMYEAINKITIKDCYCVGKILIESLGVSVENTSQAFVSNNFATGGVEHVIGDSGAENIKMYAWNNVTN